MDYNLPLFGPNSIQGRSILFHNHKIREQNRRWVCSNLKPVLDPKTHFVMKAAANFTGPTLKGMIVMEQHFSSEANVAFPDTTIFIEVMYSDPLAEPSDNHKWDIHLDPVGDDAAAPELNKRCMSLHEDLDPFGVYREGTYSTACSPTNMLRCEMGDLTNKHAPFKVNGGRQFYHDVNLPLFGKNSVVGRGMTVHEKNMGEYRVACANINADQSLFVEKSLVFKRQDLFSISHFVNVVSKALGIPKWRLFNIRIEKAEVERCEVVKFGIIGKADQVSQPVRKLSDILSGNPGVLEQYRPSDDCVSLEPAPISGKASHDHVNIFNLVVVAIAAAAWKMC